MTIRQICKLIFDGLVTAILHVMLAFVISLIFFKTVFYFYQLNGVTISTKEQAVCIISGMMLAIVLKAFVTLPLSPQESQKGRRE